MRAGPAFLQFDWSKAGLSMDLPVFVYSHTKTSFRFLSRQRKYRKAFYVITTDILLQAKQREPHRALVLSRLCLSRSTDHQDRNLHLLSHRFQSKILRPRSVHKDRGLNILQYEKQTRLINSLLDGQEMRNGKPSLKSFCDLGFKAAKLLGHSSSSTRQRRQVPSSLA